MSIDLDDYLKSELAQDLSSDRARVRRDAVTVMARLGSGTRTLEVLKTLADADADEGVRLHAREGYAELWKRVQSEGGLPGAIDERDPTRLDLERFTRYLRDESPVRRLRVLLEGIRLRDPEMLQPVLARLDREPDDWVLATLVKAVGVCGDRSLVPRIQPYLADESKARLVANTIEAIAMLDRDAARGLLKPFIHAKDSRVQATAAIVLFRVEPAEALQALRAMSTAASLRTREAAVHALSRIDEVPARDILLGMLVFETNYALVERLVVFFGSQGDHAIGGKSLYIAEAQSGIAGAYAYRRVARAIAERLGASDGDMRAAVTDVALEAFLRVAVAPERHPDPGVPGALAPAVPTRRPRSGAAAAAGVVVGLVLIGVWMAIPPASTTPAAPVVDPTLTATAVATSDKPDTFNNQHVAWEAQLVNVDPSGQVLYLLAGTARIAAMFPVAPTTARPGDRVRVRGRITSRSRFGPIHMVGQSVERL